MCRCFDLLGAVLTLHDKQATFARLLPRLIDQAYGMGYEVTLGEAWRSPEQAAWNAAHGLGIRNSLHTQRLAIDLLLFRAGVWLQDSADYQPLGEWWESLSMPTFTCCWGGRFGDGDHFSIEHEGVK